MKNNDRNKIDELKSILRRLKHFNLLSDFVDRFNRISKQKRDRSFGSKIISGEINFTKSNFYNIEYAYEAAIHTYTKIESKKKIDLKSSSLKSILSGNSHLDALEEQILIADNMYFYGNIELSTSLQRNLISIIDNEKIYKKSPYLLSKLLLSYGRNLSQFLNSNDLNKAISYIHKSISIINIEKEPKIYLDAINLLAMLDRQRKKIVLAANSLKSNENIISSSNLLDIEKQEYLYKNMHQRAVTLLKFQISDSDNSPQSMALDLVKESNNYFKEFSSESWVRLCNLREAEAQVKLGNQKEAEKLLSIYTDPLNIILLSPAQQSIYIRISAELHAIEKDFERFYHLITKGKIFAIKENFFHEIEILEQLENKYHNI